ncbi:armadillo repeat-containing protein 6 [Coffea eugenioides]|uniref:armadillo repeat-containing protein 6 n=1 Tax=Coffea eugenioides TaxID=49369 RepID=UPI000F60D5B7|nr:armadillo repeat-containing protein 6 [Coffea eugenioides]
MAPQKAVRTISQEAFDEMVKENIEDLGMDPTEALEDAVQTLSLQGVDLSGIVQCVPGESSVDDNPVVQALSRLKGLSSDSSDSENEIMELLGNLNELCSSKGSGNAAIATKNGGVELVISILPKLKKSGPHRVLDLALSTLTSLIHDLQSTETFKESGGPEIVVGILNDESQHVSILNSCFSVVAVAASGNEVVKESFMDLKIDQLVIKILKEHSGWAFPSIYDAVRVLLTADDNRVVASQVYGYARRFAKMGIVETLVHTLHEGLSSPCVVSACIALKAVAVNDEVCRSVADNGGIDAILHCIDDCGEQGNKAAARTCCSLLSKLAGSDINKSLIIEKGGLQRLIKLAGRFSEDPSVLQEVMSHISILCLRSPDNAAQAIEVGAGDLAIQAMQRFPDSEQLQRNACLMIRNLVVRNAENRKILLSHGIEKHVRKAKGSHKICKEAATDALRDLGLDNYNS